MSSNNTTTSVNVLHDPSVYLATGIYLTIVDLLQHIPKYPDTKYQNVDTDIMKYTDSVAHQLGLVATLGNVTVLSVILPSQKLRRKPHNVMIVNLAIADLAISFFGYPLTTISGYRGSWEFGDIACTATAFASFFFSLGSINTLLVICIFRYIIVCRPNTAPDLTIPVTRTCLYIVWGHALFWSGLPLLGWGKYGKEPFGTSCSIDWGNTEYNNITYIVCTVIVCYVVHVVIMTGLYAKIVYKVRSLTYGQQDRGLNIRETAMWLQKLHTDRHVTLMCFMLTSMFFCVWTPYAVVSLIYPLYPTMPLAVTTLPTMFAKAGCMLNPIVYFCTNYTFRQGCMKYFRWSSKVSVDNRQTTSSRNVAFCLTKYDETTPNGIYIRQTSMMVPVETTVF